MKMLLPDREINVFAVLYREENIQLYGLESVFGFVEMCEAYQYTGLLLFQSNRGNLEPWVFAQAVLSHSKHLSPFIAVNPAYVHPFSAAKKILSLGSLYSRKMYINFITGTSATDLSTINEYLDHESRYERLIEYVDIVQHLLRDRRPLRFSGKYFSMENAQLSASLDPAVLPDFFVAGSSEHCVRANSILGTSRFQMAKEEDTLSGGRLMPQKRQGVHFGIVARPEHGEAVEAAVEMFGHPETAAEVFRHSMENTDAVWKKELADKQAGSHSCYSLLPFRNFKSDCPYYIGSYEEVSDVIVRYIVNGTDNLVIEIPPAEKDREFSHIRQVLTLARRKMEQNYYGITNDRQFQFEF